jgi:hypothetical protein
MSLVELYHFVSEQASKNRNLDALLLGMYVEEMKRYDQPAYQFLVFFNSFPPCFTVGELEDFHLEWKRIKG